MASQIESAPGNLYGGTGKVGDHDVAAGQHPENDRLAHIGIADQYYFFTGSCFGHNLLILAHSGRPTVYTPPEGFHPVSFRIKHIQTDGQMKSHFNILSVFQQKRVVQCAL
jgi:hypothetical protein